VAARAAAELAENADLQVTTTRGRFGEFSVTMDGRQVLNEGMLSFPSCADVVQRVREALAVQAA